jgi:hypothetical protein
MLEGVGGQHHTLAALPLGKTRYPLYRRMGGPQSWSARVQKIAPPQGFDLWTIQPIASHYTDSATWSTTQRILRFKSGGHLELW